jgi:zinc transport system substrate-binding protein
MKGKLLTVISTVVLLASLLIMVGCGEKEVEKNNEEKTVVAVSIVPQKTFVEKVCGDLVDVVVMIPPGNSPANYEPTPKEMEKFSKAKLYFTIGVPTEAENILPTASEIKSLKTIKLQEEVSKEIPDIEIAEGKRDPHIWLSPKRVKIMVQSITREMSSLDVEHKTIFESNAKKFLEELDNVDQEIRSSVEAVENKKFIVFHPAFGYLADDYNLEMYALEEDGKEATPQRLKEMIDLAKKEKIKAIFYQAEISSKQAESFAEEIGGKTVQLEPLAPNYIKNLKNMAQLMLEVKE